ncbi:hypothetical protein [Psychromonas sp. SP041]|uniref:hypothetical protein n=1 Tax=Psychromonas sp. SP041 TaxID=1365007 RepID=UPI0003F6B1AA|nr:hypothetical protein [Psychromonas sp. SP041]
MSLISENVNITSLFTFKVGHCILYLLLNTLFEAKKDLMRADEIIKNKDNISLVEITKSKMTIITCSGARHDLGKEINGISLDYLSASGITIVDFSNLSLDKIGELAVLLPLPSLLPDPAPYGPMSRAPIAIFLSLAQKIGAKVHNHSISEFPRFIFKKDIQSEIKMFNDVMKDSSFLSDEKIKQAHATDIAGLERRVMEMSPIDLSAVLKKIKLVTSNNASQVVKDYKWWVMGLIQEFIILGHFTANEIDVERRIELIESAFNSQEGAMTSVDKESILTLIKLLKGIDFSLIAKGDITKYH